MKTTIILFLAKAAILVLLCFLGCISMIYASSIDNLHHIRPLYAVAINDYYEYHEEKDDYFDTEKIISEGTMATFSITEFEWGKRISWENSKELDIVKFCDFINSLEEGNIVFTNEGYYETMVNLKHRLMRSKCNIIFNIEFDYEDINKNRAKMPQAINLISLDLKNNELVVNYDFFRYKDESFIENHIEKMLGELIGDIFVHQEDYKVAPQLTFNERFSYSNYVKIFHCGCHILPETFSELLMNWSRIPKDIVRSTKLLLTGESDYFTIDVL